MQIKKTRGGRTFISYTADDGSRRSIEPFQSPGSIRKTHSGISGRFGTEVHSITTQDLPGVKDGVILMKGSSIFATTWPELDVLVNGDKSNASA